MRTEALLHVLTRISQHEVLVVPPGEECTVMVLKEADQSCYRVTKNKKMWKDKCRVKIRKIEHNRHVSRNNYHTSLGWQYQHHMQSISRLEGIWPVHFGSTLVTAVQSVHSSRKLCAVERIHRRWSGQHVNTRRQTNDSGWTYDRTVRVHLLHSRWSAAHPTK